VRLGKPYRSAITHARKAAGRLIARTVPSGLLSPKGLASAALPAIEPHDMGAKNPHADGCGFRTVSELSHSIPYRDTGTIAQRLSVDKQFVRCYD